MEPKKIVLLDYLYFLLKRKKWLAINALCVGVVSLIISFVIPKWYKAETVLAPPKQDTGLIDNMTQMLSFSSIGQMMGLGGMTEETGLYLTILESRTAMESIANKFHLQKLYKKPNIEKTIKALRFNVDITVEDEGALTIEVLDKDPQRAANMANSFSHFLDSLLIHLTVQRARNNRIYIENQLQEIYHNMEKADDSLGGFQKKHNMISLKNLSIGKILPRVRRRLCKNMLCNDVFKNVTNRNEL